MRSWWCRRFGGAGGVGGAGAWLAGEGRRREGGAWLAGEGRRLAGGEEGEVAGALLAGGSRREEAAASIAARRSPTPAILPLPISLRQFLLEESSFLLKEKSFLPWKISLLKSHLLLQFSFPIEVIFQRVIVFFWNKIHLLWKILFCVLNTFSSR